MGRRCGLLVVAIVVFMFGANLAWAGGPIDNGICPFGFVPTFNANGVGCTFCSRANSTECESNCIGSPACFCGGPDEAECCEATPCCFPCAKFDSLECNVSSCGCRPDTEECCTTICPTAPSPALGSPVSPAFVIVAAALASAGAFVLMRQRKRRQRLQIPV